MFSKSPLQKPRNTVDPCMCRSNHLEEEEDADWLEAIMEKQPDKVQAILDNATSSRREFLLSSHFVYNDGHVSQHLEGKCFRLRLPLALAIARGSREIVEILLKEGADPCQQDCHGNNVIHSMVMYTFYNPQHENSILDSFQHLVQLLPEDQLRAILLTENEYSLRPVEFAVQHGCCHLMLAIMDVPGIYLSREEHHGPTSYQWYDLTEYETAKGERFAKSPILILTFVDEQVLQTPGFKAMQSHKLFQKWLKAKFQVNLLSIALLFVFRILYISLFFVLDMDTSFYRDFIPGNSTHHCRPDFALVLSLTSKNILIGVLMVCAVFVIVLEVTEILRFNSKTYWHLHNTVDGKKNWQAQIYFYKLSNLAFSAFVFVYTVLGLIECGCFQWFYDVARVICPILAVWNILYFVQLLPSIGTFIITIQAILKDLVNFIIVLLIFMIPFMHSFQTLINTNTKVGCIESFNTPFRILYSLFITILNMVDYTSYDIRYPEVLYVVHMTYTFVVSIMMINFFIALLSESVNKYSANTLTVLHFQRAAVSMLMERRLQWIFPSIYLGLKKKCFHFEDGRVVLVGFRSW